MSGLETANGEPGRTAFSKTQEPGTRTTASVLGVVLRLPLASGLSSLDSQKNGFMGDSLGIAGLGSRQFTGSWKEIGVTMGVPEPCPDT